jgi:glycosyltransferase involved in cell wall biosynthesis
LGSLPSVTILMRSYKSHDTLPAAIESALAQSVFEIEGGDLCKILAVVPREDQRTLDIFREYDIDVVKTAEPDITKQSNVGFAAAETAYVQVLDSDDVLYPNMTVSLLAIARRTKAAVIYCDYEVWGPEGFFGLGECVGSNLRERCHVNELGLYSKKGWEKLNGFDESLWRYAQWDYFLRARKSEMGLIRVPFMGFRYAVNPDQLSTRIARGECEKADVPAWERFCAKHNLHGAVTVGHGIDGMAYMMGEPCHT